jgi:hypothetical protein
MSIDTIIAKAVSQANGAWAFTRTEAQWYVLHHVLTELPVYVRKVGDRGAFIIQTRDGSFHWTGHTIQRGLTEVADYLCQTNRKRS